MHTCQMPLVGSGIFFHLVFLCHIFSNLTGSVKNHCKKELDEIPDAQNQFLSMYLSKYVFDISNEIKSF